MPRAIAVMRRIPGLYEINAEVIARKPYVIHAKGSVALLGRKMAADHVQSNAIADAVYLALSQRVVLFHVKPGWDARSEVRGLHGQGGRPWKLG